MEMDSWILPITALPGIGMLIMSTSSILNNLIMELNELRMEDGHKDIIRRKLLQMKLLSLALVMLYIGAIFFAIAALMAGLPLAAASVEHVSMIVVCLGVFAVVAALSLLILYAYRAVLIKQAQFRE